MIFYKKYAQEGGLFMQSRKLSQKIEQLKKALIEQGVISETSQPPYSLVGLTIDIDEINIDNILEIASLDQAFVSDIIENNTRSIQVVCENKALEAKIKAPLYNSRQNIPDTSYLSDAQMQIDIEDAKNKSLTDIVLLATQMELKRTETAAESSLSTDRKQDHFVGSVRAGVPEGLMKIFVNDTRVYYVIEGRDDEKDFSSMEARIPNDSYLLTEIVDSKGLKNYLLRYKSNESFLEIPIEDVQSLGSLLSSSKGSNKKTGECILLAKGEAVTNAICSYHRKKYPQSIEEQKLQQLYQERTQIQKFVVANANHQQKRNILTTLEILNGLIDIQKQKKSSPGVIGLITQKVNNLWEKFKNTSRLNKFLIVLGVLLVIAAIATGGAALAGVPVYAGIVTAAGVVGKGIAGIFSATLIAKSTAAVTIGLALFLTPLISPFLIKLGIMSYHKIKRPSAGSSGEASEPSSKGKDEQSIHGRSSTARASQVPPIVESKITPTDQIPTQRKSMFPLGHRKPLTSSKSVDSPDIDLDDLKKASRRESKRRKSWP